ncbi:AAA family ATPase, partial [Candidatus Latescibacterota bacterium]
YRYNTGRCSMAVITISRLLGTGGDEIARQAAEGLGYDLVDSELIVGIAERAGVSVDEVRQFDEMYHSRAVEWLKSFVTPKIGKIMLEESEHLNSERYLDCCTSVINGLAEKGNMVIVGRGGQFILENDETAFHVRIIASESYRIERISLLKGITHDEARDVIKNSDRMRQQFIEKNFKRDWSNPDAYHMILDSSRLGSDVAESIIIGAAQQFSNAYEFIPGEKDRRADDRRDSQRRRGDRRDTTAVWTHRDMEKAILHDGRPLRELTKPDRRDRERRKDSRRD